MNVKDIPTQRATTAHLSAGSVLLGLGDAMFSQPFTVLAVRPIQGTTQLSITLRGMSYGADVEVNYPASQAVTLAAQ